MAIESATTATLTRSKKQSLQFQGLFDYVIPAKVVFEEDSIAAGASSAAVYTVPGCKQGDFVLVGVEADLGDDIIFTAQCTATDEVTVIATDGSAATNISAATAVNVNLLILGVDNAYFNA